ncbi:helix-turn-helix domain-containing protein [Alicyclobacillus dauci]|uniref:Helix-turn-helix domain-containing protein n=1 Tax=Alicyclobacillus dauci TaxID=1475485 RepID=A0ABY6Z5H5_9BACL|nr:helix-turn-helix domain-containing protein [Alicyclobacillus dauci]WAH38115.1 helix-turn-helix domain-containing protein [Alicyclobacillus dauci]
MLYTTDQAFDILKENGITSSRQQITKWIRQGKLKAIPFEKNKPQIGYRISHEELRKFIENKKTTREDLLKRVEELEAEVLMLKQQLEDLTKAKKRGRPRKDAGAHATNG